MTVRAGIDCGTNSIRLLIIGDDGTELVRRNSITRLGKGVDATGSFDPDAVALSVDVVREYAELCREHGVGALRFGATSATRDASNRELFTAPVTRILGVAPEVISGEEEAELSFRGALGSLPELTDLPCVLVDLGGGSTEIVAGTNMPVAAYSMNVGSVRLTERWFLDDPATPAQRAGVVADVNRALDSAFDAVPVGSATRLVGVSGTIATVTAFALGLQQRDATTIHGTSLPVQHVLSAAEELSTMSHAQLAALPFMHPGRVAVTAAGALIWFQVVSRISAQMEASGHRLDVVTTSINDILDGLAASATQEYLA